MSKIAIVLGLFLSFTILMVAVSGFAGQDDNSYEPEVPIINSIVPTLEISFPYYVFNASTQSITSNGVNYCAIGYDGWLEVYDLNGDTIHSSGIQCTDRVRSIIFNPEDSLLYMKPWGTELYTLNPVGGHCNLIWDTGFFHNSNSCTGFLDGYFYEHRVGTVYKIDIQTAVTVDTIQLNPPLGFYNSIAVNEDYIFVQDQTGGAVHAYQFDGEYVETFHIESSTSGWDLSYCNGMLFSSDHYPGGNWYGYSLEEIIPCCDVNMIPEDDPVIVEPGGRFRFMGEIGNPTDEPIVVDVWVGVIYNNHFHPQFQFSNLPLEPGYYMSSIGSQRVPNMAPEGTYEYIAYCGDRPELKCDSSWFEFTVEGDAVSGGFSEWSLEGGFIPGPESSNDLHARVSPNPFNASVSITYQLPEADHVKIEVYNILGRKVASLLNREMEAGRHSVRWDAADMASGVYFYKLTTDDNNITKRMTLLK